ncbi:MAG: hypothetical protein R3C53_04045 [Pirellulaceae bacterium]
MGFTTRSLAAAAAAEGFMVLSIDAFADHDCALVASNSVQVTEPWGTPKAADQITAALRDHGFPPILLAGGTENWPELLHHLSTHGKLLGPTDAQCRQLRDVQLWRSAATAAGIAFPEVIEVADLARFESTVASSEKLAASLEVQFLRKRYASAGGLQMERLRNIQSTTELSRQVNARQYLQRFVSGQTLGAQCVITNDGTQILGITGDIRLANRPRFLAAHEFIYAGSWGPIPARPPANLVPDGLQQSHGTLDVREAAKRLGDFLFHQTGYVGWIGFDFIQDPLGELWLLEANPRWTASMELLLSQRPVAQHLSAYGFSWEGASDPARDDVAQAKAILYAWSNLQLTAERLQKLHELFEQDGLGDVPALHQLDQVIEAGHPLLTLRATCPQSHHDDLTKQCLLDILEPLQQRVIEIFR